MTVPSVHPVRIAPRPISASSRRRHDDRLPFRQSNRGIGRTVLSRILVAGLLSLAAAPPGNGLYGQQFHLPPPPVGNVPPTIQSFSGPPPNRPQLPFPNQPANPAQQPYMAEGLQELNNQEPLWTPDSWIKPTEWDRSIEFGLNASEGNSDALSLRTGGKLKRKTEWNEIGFDLSYAKASADGVETQHNALLNAGYEQFIDGSRWTLFDKVGLEYDEFRAFDLRFWVNAGVGFQFIDNGVVDLKGRIGAGTSREFGGPSDEWTPEAVFGTDYEHQLGENNKVTATVDYFPAWEDFTDYRVVAVMGWEILLNSEHDLSLKLSVNDRYDSTPNGRNPNDVNYSLLLLWKP